MFQSWSTVKAIHEERYPDERVYQTLRRNRVETRRSLADALRHFELKAILPSRKR
jgi:hypothetical protein